MFLPSIVQQALRKLGYTPDQNLGSFWAANESALSRILAATHPHEFNCWTEQVRWTTPMGLSCQAAVLEHIKKHHENFYNLKNQLLKGRSDFTGFAQIQYHPARRLSFDSFTFDFEGVRRTLDDFQKLGRSQMYPAANLSGINLAGVHLTDCEIWNTCLGYANLDGAYISQVTLNQTTLTGASIRNARIVMVTIQNGSLNGIDVCGSFLNAIDFTDKTVSEGMIYTQVSYWFLLKSLGAAILPRRFAPIKPDEAKRHTTFLFNSTVGLQSPYNRAFRSYVDWFQFVMRQISGYRDLTLRQKAGFALTLVFTKAWTSHSVLAFWGAMTNLVFAAYYHHVGQQEFRGLEDNSYLKALYFSFVTFTTVGYGDITPLGAFSQIMVMLEIVLGYLTLGCLVFLIGHKVSDRF